jgi:CRP/FNR family transcriptional regulator
MYGKSERRMTGTPLNRILSPEIETALRPLFEPILLQQIMEQAIWVPIKKDAVFLDLGDAVRGIPLVLSGMLRVSRLDEFGSELLLYYVQPVQSCAMTFTCCMQQIGSQVRAVAEEDSVVLILPNQRMEGWLSEFPTWKAFVMNTIRNRFLELLSVIDHLAFKRLDERLLHYLETHAKATGSMVLHQSHEEIAHQLATSREVVSRLLKRLEAEGKVMLHRNEVKLLAL